MYFLGWSGTSTTPSDAAPTLTCDSTSASLYRSWLSPLCIPSVWGSYTQDLWPSSTLCYVSINPRKNGIQEKIFLSTASFVFNLFPSRFGHHSFMTSFGWISVFYITTAVFRPQYNVWSKVLKREFCIFFTGVFTS